jgi:hypothetical protein
MTPSVTVTARQAPSTIAATGRMRAGSSGRDAGPQPRQRRRSAAHRPVAHGTWPSYERTTSTQHRRQSGAPGRLPEGLCCADAMTRSRQLTRTAARKKCWCCDARVAE